MTKNCLNGLSKRSIMIGLFLSGTLTFSPASQAVEKIYFSTSDREKFWIDRDNLESRWDKNGEMARLCSFMSDNGTSTRSCEQEPIELDVNGRLFREYILDLIRRDRVTFKDKADAENTLNICEDLGLTGPEKFICEHLKRKPRSELSQSVTAMAVDTQSSRSQYHTGDCPEGYVLVPGNDSYETPGRGEDFCLMKYTASSGENGKAVSRPGIRPWVNINRADAAIACRANGDEYHLVKNAEWMTAARDIEANPENWSERVVGQGFLSRGHSNGNGSLAAGDDEDSYLGTGSTDWTHKRTHTLSNGEVIWDMAGNVWQWVADSLTSNGNGGQEYSSMQPTDNLRFLFGPSGPYDRTYNTGRLYHGTAGAVLRGGAWCNDTVAGVFAASLNDSATSTYGGIGFRCAAPVGAR